MREYRFLFNPQNGAYEGIVRKEPNSNFYPLNCTEISPHFSTADFVPVWDFKGKWILKRREDFAQDQIFKMYEIDLEKRLQSLHDSIRVMNVNMFEKILQKFSDVNERFDFINHRLNTKFDDVNQRLDTLEQDIDFANNYLTKLNDLINDYIGNDMQKRIESKQLTNDVYFKLQRLDVGQDMIISELRESIWLKVKRCILKAVVKIRGD